jgi:two-component system sensor histidine kinase MtrB
MARHRLNLGLRAQMAVYFSLAAFAAALVLSVVTYASTRTYLLDQRSDVAKRQAFNNAQLVRSVVAADRANVGDLVTSVRTERGGYAVIHLNATDTDPEYFFAQEPLRFTQSNLPESLTQRVLAGETGRQRFDFDGDPYEGVGVSVPGVGMHYFEAFPLTDVISTMRTIQTTLIVSVILITISAGLIGFTMSRNVMKPLRRVSIAANNIATGGLDTRLEPENDPDLDQLISSFNDMADAVQSRIEREQRFASDVSHELRSPVMALATAVDVLESRGDELNERNRETLRILGAQVRRFDRTVLDLLELSRLDAGAGETNLEEIHLADLCRRIMAHHGFAEIPFVDLVNNDISSERSDEVVLDRRRVERILVNLLENARDHAGGATRVTLRSEGMHFALAVEDDGPGVATSERSRIFERFARGTASRNGTGSGLGLAIVQEHAHALGGSARVEASPSGGSRFVVTIARTAGAISA